MIGFSKPPPGAIAFAEARAKRRSWVLFRETVAGVITWSTFRTEAAARNAYALGSQYPAELYHTPGNEWDCSLVEQRRGAPGVWKAFYAPLHTTPIAVDDIYEE